MRDCSAEFLFATPEGWPKSWFVTVPVDSGEVREHKDEELSPSFVEAWSLAKEHLDRMGGPAIGWVRETLDRPFVEHLSFYYDNRLFFVKVHVPSTGSLIAEWHSLFVTVSRAAKAVPCVLPMERSRGAFAPKGGGWGLVDAVTSESVDPGAVNVARDQPVEYSDLEVQSMALQVVLTRLVKEGKAVLGWQSYLHLDPSIWFREGSEYCCAVLAVVRWPETQAGKPRRAANLRLLCSQTPVRPFFASVSFASRFDAFDPTGAGALRLFRGTPMVPRFTGLVPL